MLLGQLGALLPAKGKAAAGLAAPQHRGCLHLGPSSNHISSDSPRSPPTHQDLLWDSLHHEQGKNCFQNEEVAVTSANHQPAHHNTALERRKLHSLLLMTLGICPRARALLEEQAWMTLDFQRLLEKQVFYITSREKKKQGWRKTYAITNCANMVG